MQDVKNIGYYLIFFFLFFIRNYFLGKSCWSDSTWNLTPPVVHVGWGKEGI